jgi:RecA-family ATPase
VAVLGAVDGVGKGFVATVMMLAMITGRPLLGEKVWRKGPVAIITYEDDEEEWHRRIAAACIKYELDYEYVLDNVHFIHKPDETKVTFGARDQDGTFFPDSDGIIKTLKHLGIVLLVIDPFNHAHDGDDGNNNVAIARVAGEVMRIAKATKAAVMVLHHLRKGASGHADDLMGALSLRATLAARKKPSVTSWPMPFYRCWRLGGTTCLPSRPPETPPACRAPSQAAITSPVFR